MLEPKTKRSWPLFVQLWPEVHDALGRGYSMQEVHSLLVADGKWKTGYDSFRRMAARARRELPTPQALPHHRRSSETSAPHAPPKSERARRQESIQRNPLHQLPERDPYDYSGMDPKVKDELL